MHPSIILLILTLVVNCPPRALMVASSQLLKLNAVLSQSQGSCPERPIK